MNTLAALTNVLWIFENGKDVDISLDLLDLRRISL